MEIQAGGGSFVLEIQTGGGVLCFRKSRWEGGLKNDPIRRGVQIFSGITQYIKASVWDFPVMTTLISSIYPISKATTIGFSFSFLFFYSIFSQTIS